jgi:hypothetical protein
MKKLLFIFATFALMMLSLGFLFRVMQYEGANMLVAFGLVVFTLILIIGAIRLRNLLFYSGSIAFVLLILAMIFKTLHLPGADLFYIGGNLVLSLVLIPIAGFWIYKHS